MRLTVLFQYALMAGSVLLSLPAAQAATIGHAALASLIASEETWQKTQDEKPDALPHVDPATFEKKGAHWHATLAALAKIDRNGLSPADRMNYDVLKYQATVVENAVKYRQYEMPVNSDTSFWGELAEDGQHFTKESQYRNALAKMRDLPRYFREQTDNMRSGLKRGFTSPHIGLVGRDTGILLITNARTPEDTSFYAPFRQFPSTIPAATQEELRKAAHDAIAQSVMPAYRDLLRFFDQDYVPGARTALGANTMPDGKAYYQAQIYEFTTTNRTPEDIHAFGLQEVARIRKEMADTIAASGFKGSFDGFLTFLRSDPQFYAKTPDELLKDAAWIAKEFDGVSSHFFGFLPRNRFAIRPVPADEAPFYTSARGGEDVYLVNTYNLKARALYAMPALTLHESAPGHSMQMSLVREDHSIPEFRKQYISAYGEGWALYCERLGAEMGMFHTPYETFGMLSYQAWRAARLVVDTGIHAQGWTRGQAQKYLHDNTALADHEIETEVDRYISWPGQALSYYLGEDEIWRLRHRAEKALGPKFNIKAFHDAILQTGSVPLSTMEDHIDDFIHNGGKGPHPDME